MNRLVTTTAAEGLPRRRFTVAELEQMTAVGILDEDERIEYRLRHLMAAASRTIFAGNI